MSVIATRSRNSGGLVVMFVREPEPGAVKTRLTPALGAAGAAALYRAFTEDLCAALSRRFRLALACSPGTESPHFARLRRRYGLLLLAQGTGDLGARMERVAAVALTRASRVVLVGSDAPTLPAARVEEALRWLRRRHVALGPSLDGGYYLLGLRAPLPEIFTHIPWGSERVLTRTLARLRTEGVSYHLLPCGYDIDTPADVAVLRRHLAVMATLGQSPCPRTRRVLMRLGEAGRPA